MTKIDKDGKIRLNTKKQLLPQIKDNLKKVGNINERTEKARVWLRKHIKNIVNANPKMLYKDTNNVIKDLKAIKPGQMLFFGYYPKHHATLKYYDLFPLIFPISFYDDGFLGINLHYLPPTHRQKLLSALYDFLNNRAYDETTRLNLTYSLLKNFSKFGLAKPCLKRYLYGYITSPFINIEASDWETAIYLPFENFQKKSKNTVWRESLK